MPGTDRQIHSWPAWNNGYVAKFERNCHCFCTDCFYTTVIMADTAGYYTVMAKTSGAVETIHEEWVYDTVIRYRQVCYNFHVADPHADLRVKMQVYSGEPDFYVHPGSKPNALNEFKFFSQETFSNEELVITPEMREEAELIVGEYFICVYG